MSTLASITKACPLPRHSGQHTSAVGNVIIAISENIVLLLHPHVDVPYSLVVT